MKLAGDYLFEASVQDVWAALFDPAVLAAAMPGCEKLDLVDGEFVGEMTIKVGPISGRFTGKVRLEDKVEPEHYRMIVDGRGGPGFVKATATIALAPEGPHTRLTYDADAQIGGKIASVGERLLDASARAITKQSLEGLHENIKIRSAHVAATAAAPGAAAAAVATADAPTTAAAAPAGEAAAPSSSITPVPAAAPSTAAADTPVPTSAPATAMLTPVPAASVPGVPAQPAYKRADAGELAKTVAKVAARTMLPVIIAVVVALAIAIWLLVR